MLFSLIKILSELCDNVIVISHKSDYMNIIKDSCIKNWIFSESNLNPNSENTPKIDIEKIAKIKGTPSNLQPFLLCSEKYIICLSKSL